MAETEMRKFTAILFAALSVVWSLQARDTTLTVDWSRAAMDGSRTGCTSPSADNVPETVGKVRGRTYFAPNGRIFRGGTVPAVASVVLAAQPAMAPVKKVVGYAPEQMILAEPESALSNLFIDTIMKAVEEKSGRKVDAGIGNFGGIRINMPQGDILLDDMLSMFPFRNSIVYVALEGKDLRAILEQMAATRIQILGGVRMEVCDGRIVSATIDGSPIDDDRVYGVATISFLLNGGDNLYVAKNAVEIIEYDDIDIIDVMLGYVEAETAAGRPVVYSTDGRVRYVRK